MRAIRCVALRCVALRCVALCCVACSAVRLRVLRCVRPHALRGVRAVLSACMYACIMSDT